MSKILMLFIISCSAIVHVCCQDFQDYIIKSDESIIYGTIKNQQNFTNHVSFKPINQSEFIAFKPGDILGFSKKGLQYHSIKIPNKNIIEFHALLVDGAIKLYDGKQTNSSTTFYAVKNEIVYTLNQTITIENGNEIKKNPYYLSNLKKITMDQTQYFQKVDKIRFIQKELVSLVSSYNQEFGPDELNIVAKSSFIRMKPSININVHSQGFKASDSKSFSAEDLHIAYGLGGKIDFFYKSNFHFSGGLNISKLSSKLIDPNSLGQVEFNFNQLVFQIPFEINYLFGNGKVKPKIKAGLIFTKLVKDNDQRTEIRLDNVIFSEKLTYDSKSGIGLVAGTGININEKIYIDFTIMSNIYDTLTRSGFQQITFSPFSLTIGYFLK